MGRSLHAQNATLAGLSGAGPAGGPYSNPALAPVFQWDPRLWLRLLLVLATLPLLMAQTAGDGSGRSTGLPLPRFVSINADRVNVRERPGQEYPIKWVYARAGLPVQIVQEFDTWRLIEDFEGDRGWVHSSLLSSRRTIVVKDEIRPMRRTPSEEARVALRAEPGVIGELLDCEDVWCRVEIAGRRGWLKRDEFFGTLADERLP